MNRELDGIYFRVERDGKWHPICFSDLTAEEREKVCEGRSAEWFKSLAYHLADTLKEIGERELSMVCVPNCVYRCGCPEPSGCGLYEDFTRYIEECGDSMYCLTDIGKRYALYDEYSAVKRVRK